MNFVSLSLTTNHLSKIDTVEILVSMIEMAYGLSYKEDNHTTAIMFINAQSEKINSQAVFAREQDRLKMIWILHAARVEVGEMERIWILNYSLI